MRVPLHIKLVISYLVVVALALLPTAVYLRTSLHEEQIERSRASLQQDLGTICDRLAAGPATELGHRAASFRFAFPTRVTVIAANGEVLMDSERPDARLPNHADRPEVRAALLSGVGSAERVSTTTGHRMLYVAMRFPRSGPALGVARLSERLDDLETGREQLEGVLRNAGAVALSVAVLLGLVAAVVAVRPLRTIASAARAIADGDFGTTLQIRTGDEIEDVAIAIDAIVARLRDRLVATGAEQATSQAILDELPVGVVLFDGTGQPVRLNPAARALCGLDPHVEAARGVELTRLPGQRAAMERAKEGAEGVSVELSLPWRPDAALSSRWVRVFGEDGGDAVALIVIDERARAELSRARRALADAAHALRRAVTAAPDADAARAWHEVADRCGAALEADVAAVRDVGTAPLSTLIALARADLGPLVEGRSVEVSGAATEDLIVVDAEGRARAALRTLLHWLAQREGAIEVRVSADVGAARLSGRGPVGDTDALLALPSLLRPLGGDAGVERSEDRDERWLRLTRA